MRLGAYPRADPAPRSRNLRPGASSASAIAIATRSTSTTRTGSSRSACASPVVAGRPPARDRRILTIPGSSGCSIIPKKSRPSPASAVQLVRGAAKKQSRLVCRGSAKGRISVRFGGLGADHVCSPLSFSLASMRAERLAQPAAQSPHGRAETSRPRCFCVFPRWRNAIG